MTINHRLTVDPAVDILQRRWAVGFFNAERVGAVTNRDLASLFGGEDQGTVTVFTKVKFFTTVHHVHRVLVR